MALLTAQTISAQTSTNLATLTAASAGGDSVATAGDLILRFKNASGSSITATINTPGNLPTGVAYPDTTVTVPATTGDVLISVPASLYGDSNGVVSWTYSAATSVSVAVYQLV